MKCGACGYKKGMDWVDDEYKEVNPDGEDFINIEGHFTVTSEGSWHKSKNEVRLVACPVCKMVILDDSL